MFKLEKEHVEKILKTLDDGGYLFPEFELREEIGSGGFSKVYEMVDRTLPNHAYALKIMGFEKNTVSLEHFNNTVRLQRQLCAQSPYVVRILDEKALRIEVEENGEIASVAKQEHEGWKEYGLQLHMILMEKLQDIIKKNKFGKPTLMKPELQKEKAVLEFAMQIGQALLIAHNSKILHRDIKLENIFWDEQEQKYKLGDFGNSRQIEEGGAETVIYTEGYGAPEIQCRLGDFYHATADIYSFGIVLYLLLNELRFPGSEGYVFNQIQYNPEFVFPAPKNASEQMARIIRKMCSFRQEERYQSMAEVMSELIQLAKQSDVSEVDDIWGGVELATETYREVEPRQQTFEKSRLSEKIEKLQREAKYRKGCFWYGVLFTMLFTLFITNMQTDTSIILSWQFLLFSLLVLVQSAFQAMKDFRIIFGIATIAFGVYVMANVGWNVPAIVMMVSMLFGIPVLTMSSGIATGLWIVISLSEKISLWPFLYKNGMAWIFLLLILLTLGGVARYRVECGIVDPEKRVAEPMCYWIVILMTVGGLILTVLRWIHVIEIPEIIEKLHLFRTGFISYLILSFTMRGDESNDVEQTGN